MVIKIIILRSLIIFLVLAAVSGLLIEHFNYDFKTHDYFDKRGVFFLFFVTLFPRLTLLFSSVPFGGVAWWLGFVFCPRILVAILATINYFHANPILVVLSWLIALGGEGLEKFGWPWRRFGFVTLNLSTSRPQRRRRVYGHRSDTVEAEFRRRS